MRMHVVEAGKAPSQPLDLNGQMDTYETKIMLQQSKLNEKELERNSDEARLRSVLNQC